VKERNPSATGFRVDEATDTGRALTMAAGKQVIMFLAVAAGLSGCGLVAAPCRVGSAVLKIVPLVGHVAAAPTDACADTIDPDGVTKS
jgi:hypothetical protein